ncbi:hypothetical protein IKG02_03005 [Candidatus Saccharibacteria bacterium]|nr:hypothetical protein [Candidatus Saccharibacteria bacterium]
MSDEVKEARNREEDFISHVEGKDFDSSAPKKRIFFENKKSNLKKRLPLFAIIFLLLVGVALIFISQSLLPFAIVNRLREEYNTVGYTSILRSDALLDSQLSDSAGVLALSKTQRESFLELEITPVDFSLGGNNSTALVFEKSRNKFSAVVPKKLIEAYSAEEINSAINSQLSDIIVSEPPLSFGEAQSVASFQDKYVSASKAWRGGSSGWYDYLEQLTEARLAFTRTRFANYATVALKSGSKDAWKQLAKLNSNAGDDGISSYGTFAETSENGEIKTSTNAGKVDSESLTSQTTAEGVRSALNSKIASVSKLAATAGCAGVEIGTALHSVMYFQKQIQTINYASGFLEAVQSVQSAQVGQNDERPMNEYIEGLTKKDPETKRSAIESAPAAALFSGSTISSHDEGIEDVNFESLISSVGALSSNVNLTAKAFEVCSYARMGVAAANFATTIMSFTPILGQASLAIHIAAKTVGKIALGVTAATIASVIIPKIFDKVVNLVISDVATEWTGGKLFNALSSGSSGIMGGNSQTGGALPASKEALKAFYREKNAVLAREAESERRTKSPLDVSSKNTFLGSLTYSLIPLATNSSISGVIKSFSNIFSGSINSVLPSASAIAETNMINSVGNCPILESVGIVGDANCNPYFVADTSTINISYEENLQKAMSFDANNFSKNETTGELVINPSSNLGKKTMVCDQRVAEFGFPDAQAANILVSNPSTLVANLPLVGDFAQIISASGEAKNMPWISGEACTLSEENPYLEEIKTYSRLTEDWRLLKNAGVLEETPSEKLLVSFYEKNPIDNSYEGVLARYAGMSKEQVSLALDYLDALKYLANYDSSSRLVFGKTKEQVLKVNGQDSKTSRQVSKTRGQDFETSEQDLKIRSKIKSSYAKMISDGRQFGLFAKSRILFRRREVSLLV